ncbi:haloacid dehalogenase-like hydrolase [Streptomyces sp. NPDC058373]|uniref:phosphatase domain-containing protein n=1 Tax=Streptomyces sp. NPDC058373 TaxID=3346465 RepID=UPI00364975C0
MTDARPIAVFDLDGTLADTAHRQHFLERPPRDWPGFFAAAPQDAPLPEGVALAHEAAADCALVYLTGRPERCRADTEAWLREHGLPGGPVRMRRDHDRRPAVRTKLEALRGLRSGRTVRMLVDDDPLVCAEAERAGFRVVEADWGRISAELRAGQEREGRT